MKALGRNVIVMQGEKASQRKGIVLPDSAQEDSPYGEVVLVGPDVTTVVVGDSILIPLTTLFRVSRTRTYDLLIDDKPALVIPEEEIAVVIEEAGEAD